MVLVALPDTHQYPGGGSAFSSLRSMESASHPSHSHPSAQAAFVLNITDAFATVVNFGFLAPQARVNIWGKKIHSPAPGKNWSFCVADVRITRPC